MKKIIFLLLTIISFSVYSQEPTHTKKPKTFQPGNWYMVGNWDSTAAAYKDTIGFYVENDTNYIWSNKMLLTESSGGMSVSGLINTDSSYYIKGVDLIRYNKDSFNLSIGYNTPPDSLGALKTSIGYGAGRNSSGQVLNFIGLTSGEGNRGNIVDGYGWNTVVGNTGDTVLGLGLFSGASNTLNNWIYIGLHASDTGTCWINGYSPSNGIKRIHLNGNVYVKNDLKILGDLTYTFIHGQASTDSISFTTGSTQSVYYKLNPTGADTLKSHEEVGVTFPGDSVKITVAGHYSIKCYLNISTSGASDKIRVKLFKNNAPFPLNSIGTWIINSDGTGANSETKSFEWYVTLAANDYLSVRVANLTGARACVLRDMKLIIEKKPE